MNKNFNDIRFELSTTWNQDILYNSWYDLTHYLSKDSIELLDIVVKQLNQKIKVEFDISLTPLILKYLVFKYEKDFVIDVFNFLLENYEYNRIFSELRSIVFDPSLRKDHPKVELSKKTPIYYLNLLFDRDRNEKLYRKEIERRNNNICIPSFEKYFLEYKKKYGFTYKSPNFDIKSSIYGSFLDKITEVLNNNGIDFDLKVPNTPYISIENKRREVWEKKHGSHYFNHVYFLDRTIYTPKVSKVIKDILTPELHDLYIELKIKNEIKRFFLLGGISMNYLFLDYVYKYGFKFYERHCSSKKWESYQENLKFHYDGTFGIIHKFIDKFYSNYSFGKDDQNEECKIFLVGCNSNRSDEYTKYDDFIYINTPYPDNIQIHELITDHSLYYEYLNSFNEPENTIRDLLGIPKIGEGWVSETKLFYLVKEKFNSHRVIQHGKPNWLGKQHLDIYIPDLNIGIEYQGKQHSFPVDFFGGEDSFKENLKRDLKKKLLCEQNNCRLYEVFPSDKFSTIVDEIYKNHLI